MSERNTAASVVAYSIFFASMAGFTPHLRLPQEWIVAVRCFGGAVLVAAFLIYLMVRKEPMKGFGTFIFWTAAFLQIVTVVPFTFAVMLSGAAVTQIVFFSIFPLVLIIHNSVQIRRFPSAFDWLEFLSILSSLAYLLSDQSAWRSKAGVFLSALSAIACAAMIVIQKRMTDPMKIGAIAAGLFPASFIAVGTPLPVLSASQVALALAMGVISQGIPAVWNAYVVTVSKNLGRLAVLMMVEPIAAAIFERWPGGIQQSPHVWKGVCVAIIVIGGFQLARTIREQKAEIGLPI